MNEEDIEILEKKMNKELNFLIENANKAEQLTAISIIAMKEPVILLFLSILSDYKRVLKMNEVLLKENEQLKKNYINLQDNANTTFCKVAIPPEPQLPIKTLCESFSKKVRNK